MTKREKFLYVVMLLGATSWLITLCVGYFFVARGLDAPWTEWVDMSFLAKSALAFITGTIFSLWVIAAGPERARSSIFKWFLLLFLSLSLARFEVRTPERN